jgi:hypothetical protein
VFEKNHDNYSLRSEDVGFVRTPEVIPHQINRFIAWVDYVSSRKGDGREVRSMVIKKFERKSIDKRQPSADSVTQNWQELYDRRAGQKNNR